MTYPNSKCAQWNQFASAVWGGSNVVLRHSGGIDFIDLKYYPVLQEMFAIAGPTCRAGVQCDYSLEGVEQINRC